MLTRPSTAVPMTTLLAGLGRDATARARRALQPLGLGAQQYLVLEQLRVLGRTSQATLADALGIDPSNLAVLASDLCERGLAERTRDPDDRRRYVLRLSRAGARLLHRSEGAIAAAEADLLAPLDSDERDELYLLLRRLADGIELCPAGDPDARAE